VSELELHRAPVSVGEIAYVDEGDPESPAVVFLHGFPTSSYLWRELVPLFAPWMRAIAPDLLGCGDSSKPGNASLEPHAQAGHLRELLASLGVERFAVVGHAEGGGIAQILALEGGVEALVLIDTIALDARSPMLAAAAASGGESPASRADARKAITAFLDRAVARTERPVDELRMEYLRPFSGPDGARAFDRLMRGARAGALPTAEDLSRIACPTLILWGEEDPFLPVELAERLNDAIETSSLAILPGCSHLLPEDAPQTIAPLVFEYLRSRYLGRPHSHVEPGRVMIELERGPATGQGKPGGGASGPGGTG
jgi:pimeloyl-ACP methyl ester carboxylesterase